MNSLKKAVIFDLDGTLWNCVPQIAASWNAVFKNHPEYGSIKVTESQFQSYMGKTLDQIARLIFPNLELTKSLEILHECVREQYSYLKKHGGLLYPDVFKTLCELQKSYSLYIVSNCQSGYIETFIECCKFENFFEDILCHGDTGKLKGENISLIIKRNSIDKAVYIGDTLSDYEATVAANVPFIFASYGFGNVPNSEYSIKTFSDIPKLIDKII